jgi:hypothetical protein
MWPFLFANWWQGLEPGHVKNKARCNLFCESGKLQPHPRFWDVTSYTLGDSSDSQELSDSIFRIHFFTVRMEAAGSFETLATYSSTSKIEAICLSKMVATHSSRLNMEAVGFSETSSHRRRQ